MDANTPGQTSASAIQELIADLAKGFTPTGEGFDLAAIQKLAAIGPEAVEPLLEALKEGAPWMRASVAMALGSLGDGQEAVVKALSQAWLDPNTIVASAGRLTLMRLPHPTEPEQMQKVHAKVNSRLREIISEMTHPQTRPDSETRTEVPASSASG